MKEIFDFKEYKRSMNGKIYFAWELLTKLSKVSRFENVDDVFLHHFYSDIPIGCFGNMEKGNYYLVQPIDYVRYGGGFQSYPGGEVCYWAYNELEDAKILHNTEEWWDALFMYRMDITILKTSPNKHSVIIFIPEDLEKKIFK